MRVKALHNIRAGASTRARMGGGSSMRMRPAARRAIWRAIWLLGPKWLGP